MDRQLAKLTQAGIRDVKCQHNRLNHKECYSNWTNAYYTPICQIFEVWKYFSIQFSPISKTALRSAKFPGFAHVSWLSNVLMKLVQSTGRMTGNDTDRENCSTCRKTCPSCTLYTTNTTWTDLGRNLGLHGKRLVINCLTNRMAFEAQTQLNNTYILCSYFTVNTVFTRNANQLTFWCRNYFCFKF